MTPSLLQRLADDHPQDSQVDSLSLEEVQRWIFKEIEMVLSSRPRVPAIETNPAIHNTVVNYGLEEGFFSQQEAIPRYEILRQRIATALQRFEPRLSHVAVELIPAAEANTRFHIKALCATQPLLMTLIWDDAMSCFYLSE